MNQSFKACEPAYEPSQHTVLNQSNKLRDYLSLGASLYIPAHRFNLLADFKKLASLKIRSIILCLEDAVSEQDIPQALAQLKQILASRILSTELKQSKVFVRPRHAQMLAHILEFEGVDQLYGFVLPKFDLGSLPGYQACFKSGHSFSLMPTLETKVVFSRTELEQLRVAMEPIKASILCLRVGGNDLFALLGLKRAFGQTIYESPLLTVLNDIIVCFKSKQYEVAAPVYDYIQHYETLGRELNHDLNYGLWSKSAIHPTQVPFIEARYRVKKSEFETAQALLREQMPAVFQHHGQMCEPATHKAWAERLVIRAELFGVDSEQ